MQHFWQDLAPASGSPKEGPFSGHYPAALDDALELHLPIRVLPDGEPALCSLIVHPGELPGG